MSERDKPINIKHPDKFYIGGQWVEPSTKDVFRLVEPATEEVFFEVAEAHEVDVDKAVETASTAFWEGPWPHMAPAERGELLLKMAEKMAERKKDLCRVWTQQMGGLYSASGFIVDMAIAQYQFYGQLADKFEFVEDHPTSDGVGKGKLVQEPVGVVVAIVPWNSAQVQTSLKVAPALLAGCTVVLKSSPEAPLDAYILAEIADEVGLPPGVLNVLTADRKASEHLVANPEVNKVSFTGSVEAGKSIAASCAQRVARTTLELGGKSPAIILEDYDIAAAAQNLAMSTGISAGQICAKLTRILVPRSRQQEFSTVLAETFKQVALGDPFELTSMMGPVASKRQYERINSYIKNGVEEGAELLAGGKRPKGLDKGYFIEPTIFGNVDPSMTIAKEEIFGPVLVIIPYDTLDEAIAIANDTWAGLNAGVFTNDKELFYNVAKQIRSGNVAQNAFRVDTCISFGGFKESGYGREGGVEGLRPYLESKTVLFDN